MENLSILGPKLSEIRYITNCGIRIKLGQDYFLHLSKCLQCREKSPFVNELKNVEIIQFELQDLLTLKSSLEILVNQINEKNFQEEFYSRDYEIFLLNNSPITCTECAKAQIPPTQQAIKHHLKECEEFRDNPFYQVLKKMNLAEYWDIHIIAFTIDIIYVIHVISMTIIKKLFEQSKENNQQYIQQGRYKCSQCSQYKENVIQHKFEKCQQIICTDCYKNSLHQQIEENSYQLCCLSCKTKLSPQFIYDVLFYKPQAQFID